MQYTNVLSPIPVSPFWHRLQHRPSINLSPWLARNLFTYPPRSTTSLRLSVCLYLSVCLSACLLFSTSPLFFFTEKIDYCTLRLLPIALYQDFAPTTFFPDLSALLFSFHLPWRLTMWISQRQTLPFQFHRNSSPCSLFF